MSKIQVDTIDTRSGTSTMQIGSTNTSTINIGVSGDTVNIPAGVTIANAGTATGFGAFSYSHSKATGDGSTTAFTVTNGQTVHNVLVFENGVCQEPTTDYTISGTTLTFGTAPASGVKIVIREL